MKKKTEKAAPKKKRRSSAGRRSEDSPPAQIAIESSAAAVVAGFTAERDDLIGQLPQQSAMPASEEAFYSRDPFSADYTDFVKEKGRLKRQARARVDGELRADLLAKPYLMEVPDEAAHRGAGAVWRSLRDQLHNESLGVIDGSDIEEIKLLERELKARKLIVAAVSTGIDDLLKRVGHRLNDLEGGKKPIQGDKARD